MIQKVSSILYLITLVLVLATILLAVIYSYRELITGRGQLPFVVTVLPVAFLAVVFLLRLLFFVSPPEWMNIVTIAGLVVSIGGLGSSVFVSVNKHLIQGRSLFIIMAGVFVLSAFADILRIASRAD